VQSLDPGRRGFPDAVDALNELYRGVTLSPRIIADYLLAFRFCGLEPRPEMEEWIKKGLALLSSNSSEEAMHLLPSAFQEHWGCFLLARGHTAQAESLLESARREMVSEARQRCRTTAVLANAKRILGKPEEAAQLLEEACEVQTRRHFDGDLADFTLLNLAKLQSESDLDAAKRASSAPRRSRWNRGIDWALPDALLEARLHGEATTPAAAGKGSWSCAARCPPSRSAGCWRGSWRGGTSGPSTAPRQNRATCSGSCKRGSG